MDSESDQSNNSTSNRKKPRRNRRLQSSDSDSSNESDPSASLTPVDFDNLKNDITFEANVNSSIEDPLLLPSDEANIQNNNDDGDGEKISSDRVHSSSDIDNEDAENGVHNACKIKLVPLEQLLSQPNATTNSSSQCQSVDISSDSSSDQLLVDIVKKPETNPKKRFSKSRRTAARNSSCNEIYSNESDSNDDVVPLKAKSKHKSKANKSHDINSVKVRLTRLPTNLEPLLKRFNLSEIRDRHQNILVSRPSKTHRNEVHINNHHISFLLNVSQSKST